MSDIPAGAAEPVVPPDPIYQKSYSVHIAVASVALVGAVALAIADEVWQRRPYKAIQREYKEVALAYLDRVHAERASFEDALRGAGEFKTLQDAVAAAREESAEAYVAAQTDFLRMSARAAALGEALRVHRSEIAALTYDAEHAAHAAGDADALTSEAAKSYSDRIAKIRALEIAVAYDEPTVEVATDDEGNWRETVVKTPRKDEPRPVGELISEFLDLQVAKGAQQVKVGLARAKVSEAEAARDAWLRRNLASFQKILSTPYDVVRRNGDDEPEVLGNQEELAKRVVARVKEVGLQRYLDDHATTLPAAAVAKVRARVEKLSTDPFTGGEIQDFQIHLASTANWVDRCQVCHLGVTSEVPMHADDLREVLSAEGWPNERIESAKLSLYESHPRAGELFAHHDPAKMGCSTCHNGNGIAVTSVDLAHGQNHHWLWPLHPKENLEAGCLQCHQSDAHLASGVQFNRARKTFLEKGCWGCHPYEGYDAASAEIKEVRGRIAELSRLRDDKDRRTAAFQDVYGAVPEESSAAYEALKKEESDARARLVQEKAQVETEIQGLERRLAGLWSEREKVGPNLKELRIAMIPEVVTPWVQDPHSVRPNSKMPTFRWWGAMDAATGLNEEAKDVAAFLWQTALDPAVYPELRAVLDRPIAGSAGRGKQLLEDETLGCLGCHGVTRDGKLVGNDFAAELTQVGGKKTIQWIYRWIKDPQHRLVPYSVTKSKDLTAEEAAKEDRATLVWDMPTVMPDFRLSDQDAADLATYLSTLGADRKWPDAPWLTDESRRKRGEDLVRNYGCAGCHEIAGLENERGIGTELTKEGSKPLDRLDFGHVTTEAKRGHEPIPDWTSTDGVKVFAPEPGHEDAHGGWYRPRGYFMHKLAKPDLFDSGKYFADRFLRSRMPSFRLTAQELHDLTTFLLGSVDTRIPETSRYRPGEEGQAIREGWWVIRKYNCQGCHAIDAGDIPDIQKLPWQDEAQMVDNPPRDKTFPPTLVGVGFRLRPDFLADFLRDPSLGHGTERPTSVRRHLRVRMPTFELSDGEIAKLVRFFGAKAKQPPVFRAEPVPPLSAAERAGAKAIWDKANCIQCHVIGDTTPVTVETKAPDIAYTRARLRPEWMRRWIPRPAELMNPHTSMTNNFKRDEARDRWVYEFHDQLPEMRGVDVDHVELLIRYLYELGTPPR